MLSTTIILSIGALNAIVPVLVIIILIAAAAGLTRGFNIFNIFGVATLLGGGLGAVGGAARGATLARSGWPFRSLLDPSIRLRGTDLKDIAKGKKLAKVMEAQVQATLMTPRERKEARSKGLEALSPTETLQWKPKPTAPPKSKPRWAVRLAKGAGRIAKGAGWVLLGKAGAGIEAYRTMRERPQIDTEKRLPWPVTEMDNIQRDRIPLRNENKKFERRFRRWEAGHRDADALDPDSPEGRRAKVTMLNNSIKLRQLNIRGNQLARGWRQIRRERERLRNGAINDETYKKRVMKIYADLYIEADLARRYGELTPAAYPWFGPKTDKDFYNIRGPGVPVSLKVLMATPRIANVKPEDLPVSTLYNYGIGGGAFEEMYDSALREAVKGGYYRYWPKRIGATIIDDRYNELRATMIDNRKLRFRERKKSPEEDEQKET